jgi:hypothetical protein
MAVEPEAKQKKKEKESIPKLQKEDRADVLPVIVRLLFSKLSLQSGKGKLKQLNDRRTIIYQFYASLDPETEYPIFFKELLQPLGI